MLRLLVFRLELPQNLVLRPSMAPAVPALLWPTTAASCYVQSRGKKQKFGGITRDPFKTFQKKLAHQQQRKHAKFPLKSEERSQREMLMPINLTSLNQLISDHVPPEKFARAPIYTRYGRSQRWTGFKEGLLTVYAGATIKRQLRKVDPFRPIEFARKAQQDFLDINSAIQRKDKQTLRSLATEQASESLKKEFEYKRFDWQMVEELERPRVVSARVAPLITKDNLFAQVVVRMHTKQILALYDTANKLIRGHPTNPKTVIDYVVFERHISKPGSSWRVCTKLPPQLPWKTAQSQKDDSRKIDRKALAA